MTDGSGSQDPVTLISVQFTNRKGRRQYRVKNKSNHFISLDRQWSGGQEGPFGRLNPGEGLNGGNDQPIWCTSILVTVNGSLAEKWTRRLKEDDFQLEFSKDPSNLSIADQRRAEIRDRLRETKLMSYEDALSKYTGGNDAQFWSHTSAGERIPISPLDGDATRTPSMALSTTSLSAPRVPSLLSTVLPIYLYDRRNVKSLEVSFMSLGKLSESAGAHVFEVVMEAFRNFTVPASNTPFTDMSLETVVRHTLMLYVIRSRTNRPPEGALHTCLDRKMMFLSGLLDTEHVKPDDYDDDVFAASAFVGSAKEEVIHAESATVVAFGCRTHMDIWHTGNTLSPAHQSLLTQLSKTFRNSKCVQEAKLQICLDDLAVQTLQTYAMEKQEEKADEEFANLNFEDLLRDPRNHF